MYERRHATGAVSRVTHTTYLGFTSYQATSYRLDTLGNLADVRVEAGYETLEEAERRADDLAHAGCAGSGCGRWGPAQGRGATPAPAESSAVGEPAAARTPLDPLGGAVPKPST